MKEESNESIETDVVLDDITVELDKVVLMAVGDCEWYRTPHGSLRCRQASGGSCPAGQSCRVVARTVTDENGNRVTRLSCECSV